MTLRHSICHLVATTKFRRAGATLVVDDGAQLRTFALHPARGGHFSLGTNSIFCSRLAMDRDGAAIKVGDRTFVGKGLLAAARGIDIGSDVLLSWNVTVVDHQSHHVDFSKRARDVTDWLTGAKDWTHVESAPVRICDKAWIGFGASILPGVTVGEGAVVGACSVVTRDVEPWTVVAGNPAREIRRLDPDA